MFLQLSLRNQRADYKVVKIPKQIPWSFVTHLTTKTSSIFPPHYSDVFAIENTAARSFRYSCLVATPNLTTIFATPHNRQKWIFQQTPNRRFESNLVREQTVFLCIYYIVKHPFRMATVLLFRLDCEIKFRLMFLRGICTRELMTTTHSAWTSDHRWKKCVSVYRATCNHSIEDCCLSEC